jgi:hypothetical protein
MAVAMAAVFEPPVGRKHAHVLTRVELRAMALWPRLNRRSLLRCGGDPARIACYVSKRTRLPVEEIEKLLTRV